jgi:hypothetical protein
MQYDIDHLLKKTPPRKSVTLGYLLLVFVTALMLLVVNTVQQGYSRGPGSDMAPPGDRGPRPTLVETILAELNKKVELTTVQQAEVTTILNDLEQQQHALREASQGNGDGAGEQPGHEQVRQLREEAVTKVGDFLNDEQLTALKDIMEKVDHSGPPGSPPRDGLGAVNSNRPSF